MQKEETKSQLSRWLKEAYDISVSQVTVSKIFKRSSEFHSQPGMINPNVMRQRQTKVPIIERALIEWFHLYEETIPMSGDIIKQKGSFLLGRFYLNESFNFSNGWLQSSKNRHHISSTRRFGEWVC